MELKKLHQANQKENFRKQHCVSHKTDNRNYRFLFKNSRIFNLYEKRIKVYFESSESLTFASNQ